MGTMCCPVVPPCTLVSLTGCRRKSLLPLRGSTPSGSVAPSWLPCPPSSRCGSASRNTMRQAPALSTGSASKYTSPSPLHHLQTPSNHKLSWRFFYGGRPLLWHSNNLLVNGLFACAVDICIFKICIIFYCCHLLSVLHLRTSCEYQP